MTFGDERGDHRLASGLIEGHSRHPKRDQSVQRPDGWRPAKGDGCEQARDAHQDGLGDEEELAAVEGIGHDTAEDREEQDGSGAHQTKRTKGDRRVRENVNLPGDGGLAHLAAGSRDELPYPEQPEVVMRESDECVKRAGFITPLFWVACL